MAKQLRSHLLTPFSMWDSEGQGREVVGGGQTVRTMNSDATPWKNRMPAFFHVVHLSYLISQAALCTYWEGSPTLLVPHATLVDDILGRAFLSTPTRPLCLCSLHLTYSCPIVVIFLRGLPRVPYPSRAF